MRIGIAGPISTPDVEHLLEGDTSHLPRQMKGASLLVSLIESLIQKGHEVVAYTTDPALLPRRENVVRAQGQSFAIYYVPRRRHAVRIDRGARGRMLDFFALERRALVDAMLESRPDIIHAHWTYEFSAAALDSGLPCLVTCHDSPWAILKTRPDLYRVMRLLMAKSVLRRIRYATVVSPYLIEELRDMTPAALSVVPNPIPDWVFKIARSSRSNDFQDRSPRIAMVLNGWSARKNPETAMLAMEFVREIYPNLKMHLYGPGFGVGEQAWRWAAARDLRDAFVFHGWTAYATVMNALASMDILVHPATEESFGMTVAEAMALGVPVVAGRESGAVPWVLGEASGGGGALVDVRSPEKIAEAISTLLGNHADYMRYVEQGRAQAIRRFSASAVAHAYLEQYQRVLASAGVAPCPLINEASV